MGGRLGHERRVVELLGRLVELLLRGGEIAAQPGALGGDVDRARRVELDDDRAAGQRDLDRGRGRELGRGLVEPHERADRTPVRAEPGLVEPHEPGRDPPLVGHPLLGAEAPDVGDERLQIGDPPGRPGVDRDADGGGPRRRDHGLGPGERLVERLGEERRHRVQQPHQHVEDVAEHRAGALGRACRRELRLGQLQVPVAQLVPREVVERLGGLGELEVLEQRIDLRGDLVQPPEDPRVGVGERARERTSAPAVDGRGSAGEAPLARANRAAFHSFVPKLRAAATLSSPIGASTPGLATRASAKRVASVP